VQDINIVHVIVFDLVDVCGDMVGFQLLWAIAVRFLKRKVIW